MKIEIKKALLEGHTPEVIVEAIHVNHPRLDKRNPENISNRGELARKIRSFRSARDEVRPNDRNPNGSQNYVAAVDPQGYENNQAKANKYDNQARVISQRGDDVGLAQANEFAGLTGGHRNIGKINAAYMASAGYPRVISSAKK